MALAKRQPIYRALSVLKVPNPPNSWGAPTLVAAVQAFPVAKARRRPIVAPQRRMRRKPVGRGQLRGKQLWLVHLLLRRLRRRQLLLLLCRAGIFDFYVSAELRRWHPRDGDLVRTAPHLLQVLVECHIHSNVSRAAATSLLLLFLLLITVPIPEQAAQRGDPADGIRVRQREPLSTCHPRHPLLRRLDSGLVRADGVRLGPAR
ncbi:hypothetical protein DFJ73DRAFT_830003, partial [Zopfochytrium polystomum]